MTRTKKHDWLLVITCVAAWTSVATIVSDALGEKLTLWDKEVAEGRRILVDEDSYPRQPAKLIEGPTVRRDGHVARISFVLDKADDVLVRIVNAKGETVRELGCGVLGANAPPPFAKNSLRQEIVWDGTDKAGKLAPRGCKVRVSVGLRPRFDRFVAYDPKQLLPYICGMEVDSQGRVYVALFTDRRGDPHVVRYDREGNYLETVYPPNPNLLAGKLEDVYPYCEYVDGKAVPERVGGPWPYIIYKYHSAGEGDPARYQFPLRIASDGRAYIGETHTNSIESGLLRAQWNAVAGLKARILPVKLDPFWFLEGMTMGEGPWALDTGGFAYLCRRESIVKVSLAAMKPVADFEYSGTKKLATKQSVLGSSKKRAGSDERLFQRISDLTIDGQGNIYVVDTGTVKVFQPNGQLVKTLDRFQLGGKSIALGEVYGVRAADDELYAVTRITRSRPKGPKEPTTGRLVKLALPLAAEPKAVWMLPLDGLAGLVAVDNKAKPPVVWVAGGGGPATFTRVVDTGDKPGEVRHCGSGTKKGTLVYPWSIALDAKGRLFAYDYSRRRIVRTNDDGSEWFESSFPFQLGVKAMHVDRQRGRLFVSQTGHLLCYDLDVKKCPDVSFSGTKVLGRAGVDLGAVDAEGNLYVSDLKKGSKQRGTEPGLHGVVKAFWPDGKLKQDAYCETFLANGGLAMDSKGSLYVMDTCRMGFMDAVHNWARGRGIKWKRGEKVIRAQSDMAYLVKFPPGGGTRGTDRELWAHRGVSPVMGGGCICPISTNSLAIDEADRIFATDYVKYNVKVFDTAGNMIARIGAWGNADCQGPGSKYPEPEIAFNWVHSLDTFGDSLYASDKDLRRVVKVRMDYRQVEEVAVAVPAAASKELTVEDFSFEGPLGSKGATIERLGPNHFKVKLARADGHPEWSSMLQFTILRNAKGKRLRLDGGSPGMRAFVSWSYDGKNWNPIRQSTVVEGSKKVATLQFPVFTEDRVQVGGEVPMSYEDMVEMINGWKKHPHATVHVLGKSLGGRDVLRLTVTDPKGPHPMSKRWAHHAVNQHCYEYNSQWRIAGMIQWLLSEAGADCRRRQVCHFVVMMNVDGPAAGYGRVNSQGIDMNRSYSADGTNKDKQAREAYLVQKDLEALMASETPPVTTWSMHTWAGREMEIMLRPGPEMKPPLGPSTTLEQIIERNDTRNRVKPLRVLTSPLSPTHWCSGTHKQFGVSAFCCEGTGNLYTKSENLNTGALLMKSLAEYYKGTRK